MRQEGFEYPHFLQLYATCLQLLHLTSACYIVLRSSDPAYSCIVLHLRSERHGHNDFTVCSPASQSTSTTLVPNMIGQVRRNPGTPDLESCRSIRKCFSSVTTDLPASVSNSDFQTHRGLSEDGKRRCKDTMKLTGSSEVESSTPAGWFGQLPAQDDLDLLTHNPFTLTAAEELC